MTDLSAEIGGLSAEQLALLQARLQRLRRKEGEEGSRRISRREAGSDGAPLAFQQERLWFLDQLDPGSSAYNIPGRPPGRCPRPRRPRPRPARDRAAARGAAHHLPRRGRASRCRSSRRRPAFPLPLVDLSALPRAARAAIRRAGRARGRAALRPRARAADPRPLLRLAPDEHVLQLTLHHIVSDGWSVGILVRELSALYSAFAAGRPSPLPPLPVQYADYARWQRGWLDGGALAGQLDYWRRQLAGAPAVLELPTDRPRPAVADRPRRAALLALPPPLAAALRALAGRTGATLFMVLLAAFQALAAPLHRPGRRGAWAPPWPTAPGRRSRR